VRLQKLDAGDRLAEVVLVPPAPDEEELAAEPVDGGEAGPAQPASES
jgi:DNA gyrase subunit A